MDLQNKYSIYIGSARGTITHTNLQPESKINYEFAAEASEISSMSWGRQNDEILVGYKNGIVNIYDTNTQKYVKSLNTFINEGAVVGLGSLENKILVTSSNGKISITDTKKNVLNIMTLSSEESTLETSSQNMNKLNIIATGGESNDLKLWDVETKQCVFKAKSMGHDFLNLPIKTSVKGITFIPEEQNLCCCATKEGHILLYDDRTQRRPVCKYLEPKASFTSVTTAFRERNVLAGTTKGFVEYVDMKNGKLSKTFTNINGSVTCVLCDPIEPILFTTSLDRYLRIFNLDTKEVIYKQYLKQNLKRVLVMPVVKEEEEPSIDINPIEDDEYEEIFKNMEVIMENPAKKSSENRKEKLVKKRNILKDHPVKSKKLKK